ncbi:MAG: hypothetical protein RJA59_2000 [Pseudomonadota bacterium]|jgi:hypothetical protein
MLRSRLRLVLPVAFLLASCATTSSRESVRGPPVLEEGVQGGIAWMRSDDYLTFQAAWAADRVTAGPRARPATGYFVRGEDGTWSTGVTKLEVTDSRITGPKIDVAITRVDGGFRLTGFYFMYSVDLLIDAKGASAHQLRWVRDPSGAYDSVDAPQTYFWLVGDAARLDDPPWPEIAFAALAARFGLGTGGAVLSESWR